MHKLIYVSLIIPLLAACSSSTDDGENAKDFPKTIPLAAPTLHTQITTTSKATSTSAETWQGTEKLAIRMVSTAVDGTKYDIVKAYTPDASSDMLKISNASEEPFFFRSPNEPVRTCTAWHLPRATGGYQSTAPDGTKIAVAADQSKDGVSGSDFLYCPATTVAYQYPLPDDYCLLFCHQLSLLSFLIVADDPDNHAITSEAVGTTDAPMITAATFSASSGLTTSTGSRELFGSYASTDVTKSVVIPATTTKPATEGYVGCYEAVVIPQTFAKGNTLFSVTVGDKTYKYVYNADKDLQLLPGFRYTFHLELLDDNQLLVLVSANNWDEKEKEIGNDTKYITVTLWQGGTKTGTTGSATDCSGKIDTGTKSDATTWDSGGVTGTKLDATSWKSGGITGTTGIVEQWQLDQISNTSTSNPSETNWQKEGETIYH